MAEEKTEIEIGGIKFAGGKLFAVGMALSSAAGVVWAGALFWADYLEMKAQIEEYVAPDMSGIEQQLAVQMEAVDRAVSDLQEIRDDNRDALKRLYTLETDTQRELLDLRKTIRTSIQEALENPLAGQ
jgi:hypothetical protein